ncbi:MAG TPA: class I SAM-dependent rRNA methyltransferase [Candidatus Latescibacteria bacterium]|nr:class I SAM-dependent rRNA methyltransferase [Candidatus Latescibacterota bacterium]
MNLPRVFLTSDGTGPASRRHPWIYSGAVAYSEGAEDGELVAVYKREGTFLGVGFYNSLSDIMIRILSFEPVEDLPELLRERIRGALSLREAVVPPDADMFRVVNSEGDGLPGLVVDRYGPYLVVQMLAKWTERHEGLLVDLLREECSPKAIFLRAGGKVVEQEGISPKAEWVGVGERYVWTQEYGHRFKVDLEAGQKTGFFLDQRENRRLVEGLARGRKVLDIFGYTGAFSVYAASGGAEEVLMVEASAEAVGLAQENFRANDAEVVCRVLKGDVFEVLPRRNLDGPYDLVVLDPPALAKARSAVPRALKAYRALNKWAMKAVADGGLLLSCSCSPHVDRRRLQEAIFTAALEAKREVQVLEVRGVGPDHPFHIFHPEGEYLKVFLLRVA